jgi:hypothetical protein
MTGLEVDPKQGTSYQVVGGLVPMAQLDSLTIKLRPYQPPFAESTVVVVVPTIVVVEVVRYTIVLV